MEKSVPFVAYEAELVRMERINRRLSWLTAAALLAAAGAWAVVLLR